MTAIRQRAVFLPDIHLGSRHCHAEELANFLAGLSCERLYLVGDIADLWWMAQRRALWGQAQHRVVEALHALHRSGAAERFIARFMHAALVDARRRGLDGVICGHIHRPSLMQQDGLVYANDGDWVENLTALAEDRDGTLRLLSHTGDTLAELSPRLRLVMEGVLPKAA